MFMIIVFSEFIPKRKELIDLYRPINDIVMSTNEQINLDIYEGVESRIEYNEGYNACMYLKNSEKSKMISDAIELIAWAISERSSSRVKFFSLKEKMTGFAENNGMISRF